jgi:hypothetical protein
MPGAQGAAAAGRGEMAGMVKLDGMTKQAKTIGSWDAHAA